VFGAKGELSSSPSPDAAFGLAVPGERGESAAGAEAVTAAVAPTVATGVSSVRGRGGMSAGAGAYRFAIAVGRRCLPPPSAVTPIGRIPLNMIRR